MLTRQPVNIAPLVPKPCSRHFDPVVHSNHIVKVAAILLYRETRIDIPRVRKHCMWNRPQAAVEPVAPRVPKQLSRSLCYVTSANERKKNVVGHAILPSNHQIAVQRR